MKQEPLTKKDIMYYPHNDKEGFVRVKKLKSAVGWLKRKLKTTQLSNIDYRYICLDIDKAFGSEK